MEFNKKNYTNKIRKTIPKNYVNYSLDDTAHAINEFINFMNYCFLTKNNFFVENFNKKQLRDVCYYYNQMKSNILINNKSDNTIFDNINLAGIKQLKFILIKNLNNKTYDNFEWLSKNGLTICLDLLNHYMDRIK